MWPYQGIPDCPKKIYASVPENSEDPVRLPGSFGFGDVNLVPITPVLTILNPEVPHAADELDGVLPRKVGFVLFDGSTSDNVGFVTVYQHSP